MNISMLKKRHPAIINFILFYITSHVAISTSEQNDLGDLDLYKIAWKGPLTASTFNNFKEENVINISTKRKERYKCIVPDDVDQLNFDTSAKNSSSETQTRSPYQVLEPLLNSTYCSIKIELFWVYELCHGKFLRQFHEERTKYNSEPKVTQEYYLGKLEKEKIKDHIEEYERESAELDRSGQSRPTVSINGQYKPYVMFNMTGGTKCDLTTKDRVSRILYVCNEEHKHELYSIKEISTCEYEAIVLTPLLCTHKDYKVDANTQHEIQCFSIGDSPRKPLKIIETDEEDDMRDRPRRRGVAYFQGRTLIIDAELILS